MALIAVGTGIFMVLGRRESGRGHHADGAGGGAGGGVLEARPGDDSDAAAAREQAIGVVLLLFSLCFDGATGALEDRYMSDYEVTRAVGESRWRDPLERAVGDSSAVREAAAPLERAVRWMQSPAPATVGCSRLRERR